MNNRKRVYINEETYNKIIDFAKRKYECTKIRSRNNKPLYMSFPCALEEYLRNNK